MQLKYVARLLVMNGHLPEIQGTRKGTVWGKGRNEMESYLVRFMVRSYNWSVQEMVVPKERAIRMLSDESLLILRMEIQ